MWAMLAAPLIAVNQDPLGTTEGTFEAKVPAHDVLMLRLDEQ